MSLAKQLSATPNQESNAGWSRLDSGAAVEIVLTPDIGASYRLNLTSDSLAGIFNKYGEAIPSGTHRRGTWGVKEEAGQKILYLCRNVSDLRPGSLWYASAPALLSQDRIARLQTGLTVQVLDEGRRTAYAVQDGLIGDCLDTRVVAVAKADGCEGSTFVEESLLVFAQLRDVLTAKNSSIVAKKNDDRRLTLPQRSQASFLAKSVGKNDVCEPLAESFQHDGS